MSQQKVDQHKEDKKKREAKKKEHQITSLHLNSYDVRRNKVLKAITVFVLALAVGAGLGIPIGKGVYNYQKKQSAKYATISSLEYSDWFDKYWVDNYSDYFTGGTFATGQDAIDQINSISSTATDADTE